MVKTSKKFTKDPKRQEQGKKSHETYMKRLKKQILTDKQLIMDIRLHLSVWFGTTTEQMLKALKNQMSLLIGK